jgi:threonine dehydrogenase-like Zn-dependent dehydrogenase
MVVMKALRFERNIPRFGAAMVAGRLSGGAGAKVGPLRLRSVDPPALPGDGWVEILPRLSGICGSDLSTIDGHSSRYFEPIVSFPFVPGHEVVADLAAPVTTATGGGVPAGRVVIEPVLGCVTRGIAPACDACARGDLGNCEHIAFGALEPGLQSGFCCDTGGGWSTRMVAHSSQLHAVPDGWTDEAAVIVEPTACAVHGALAAQVDAGELVVVLGSGALGLLTIAALRRYGRDCTILAVAKHPHQRSLAKALGADTVIEPGEIARAVRRATGSMALGDGDIIRLTGGADHVIDCVGSESSLAQALGVVRPKGRITMVGMPGHVHVDLTGLWQREITLSGAYAYGTETLPNGDRRRTFDLAFELVAAADLGRLVSATYPLSRYEEAIAHAAHAGARGAVRVAFDLRNEKERKHA